MWVLLENIKQWIRRTSPVSRCRESSASDTTGVCVSIPNMALMIWVYSEQLCSQQSAQWHGGLPDQPRDWLSPGCPGRTLKDAGDVPVQEEESRRAGSGSYVKKQVSSISSCWRPLGKHKTVYNYRLVCFFTVSTVSEGLRYTLCFYGRAGGLGRCQEICKLPPVHSGLQASSSPY